MCAGEYQIKANAAAGQTVTDAEEQSHFDDFFEEIFVEVEDAYGEVEEMNVCDNIGEHMIGNVYIKVRSSFPFLLQGGPKVLIHSSARHPFPTSLVPLPKQVSGLRINSARPKSASRPILPEPS